MKSYSDLTAARAATLDAIDRQQWAAALAASRAACTLCAQILPPATPSLGIERVRLIACS